MEYRSEDHKFAMEANDLLREVWNLGLFNGHPVLKERLAKLLEVKDGEDA